MQKQTLIKNIATTATLGVIALNSFVPAFAAVTPNPTNVQQRQQNRQQLCSNSQTIINDRIRLRQDIANQFKQRYENLKTRLDNIQTKVSTTFPSIDLTSLKADITKLDELYKAAVAQSDKAQDAFSNVDFSKCLSGTGEFKAQLQNARLLTKQASDAHKAYWTFVKDTVKTDLQKIKSDIQALKTV
jgi:hypothetical protein